MTGTRLGVDVGSVRIGVARCDAAQILTVPVETVPQGDGSVARVAVLAREWGAGVVYVGLPLSLNGGDTPSTASARAWARALASDPELQVQLVDERLSTKAAERSLREAGRSSKASRGVIDQAAAIVLLGHALEIEKRTGQLAGEHVEGDS